MVALKGPPIVILTTPVYIIKMYEKHINGNHVSLLPISIHSIHQVKRQFHKVIIKYSKFYKYQNKNMSV